MSFFEVKNKQASWFTNKVERLYWEQWYINLNVVLHPKAHSGKFYHSKVVVDPEGKIYLYAICDGYMYSFLDYGLTDFSSFLWETTESDSEERNARRAALESSLHEVLFQIIKFVNEKKDHVPPIPNLDGVSFPYEITISR